MSDSDTTSECSYIASLRKRQMHVAHFTNRHPGNHYQNVVRPNPQAALQSSFLLKNGADNSIFKAFQPYQKVVDDSPTSPGVEIQDEDKSAEDLYRAQKEFLVVPRGRSGGDFSNIKLHGLVTLPGMTE